MPPIIRTITIRSKAKAGNLDNLSIEPFGISTKGAGYNEELRWVSVGTRITSFTIDFNYGGSPLGWTKKTSVGGTVDSGQVTAGGVNPNPFNYTIEVDLKKKGTHPARTVVIDPEVIVDDDTPPPVTAGSGSGGKKKAAKKKAAKKKTAKKGASKKSKKSGKKKAARKTGRKKK